MKSIKGLSSALGGMLICASLLWANTASAALVLLDKFDYPAVLGADPVPVPSPWEWSVSGKSFNTLWYGGSTHGEDLLVHYSGSGSWTLDRYDVAGSNRVYSIEYWDDGSAPVGEMFMVYQGGDFIAIAANDNVAPGQYYVRTASNSGNTGTIIPVKRNSTASSGGWHKFSIAVTPLGSYPMVDSVRVPGYWYNNISTAEVVRLTGNWGKKVHDSAWDNFRVDSLYPSNIPDGTQVLVTGALFTWGGGSDQFASLTLGDFFNQLYTVGTGLEWAQANPLRAAIVRTATIEATQGLCGSAARSKYNASGAWCSEFSRWVLLRSGVPDYTFPNSDSSAYTRVSNITATAQLTQLYYSKCGFKWGGYVTPSTPQPGDFVAEVGTTSGDFGHSEIVVGVDSEGRYIWTVGGNVDDCVRFQKRDLFVNGQLSSQINGFGNTQAFVSPILTGPSLFCRYFGP